MSRPGLAELRLVLIGGIFFGLAAAQLSGGGDAGMLPFGDSVQPGPTLRVIDGDTFDYAGERIRVADIDTPELSGACLEEIALAQQAKRRMGALLRTAAFELHPLPSGRDEDGYGRKLRIVTRDGRSLGDVLVAEGLARTWTGRREPWCA